MATSSLERSLFHDKDPLSPGGFSYMSAFNDVLTRIREHVDPNLKLKAVHDLKILSHAFQQLQQTRLPSNYPTEEEVQSRPHEPPRRRSLNPSSLSSSLRRHEGTPSPVSADIPSQVTSEGESIRFLKGLLFMLQPKTLFRDLQYIAAFVSSQTLDNTELGRAFLRVGLAALDWKDEMCRGMVDVADRIVARDSIKRGTRPGPSREPSVLKAAEYWVIAAREGNAIAQRELAGLYLTHPEVPPIVSLPLALSSEIFKNDMMWEEVGESRRSRQVLCLALHWMQQAAENGDSVAQSKLQERRVSRLVR